MQSLIRTAEQLKIKGLCEINEHTNDSDTEIVNYPPYKKLRTSKKFEYRSNIEHFTNRPGTSKDSTAINLTDKNVPSIVLLDNNNKSATLKESSKSNNNSSGSKNMASLEMGMVGMVSLFN